MTLWQIEGPCWGHFEGLGWLAVGVLATLTGLVLLMIEMALVASRGRPRPAGGAFLVCCGFVVVTSGIGMSFSCGGTAASSMVGAMIGLAFGAYGVFIFRDAPRGPVTLRPWIAAMGRAARAAVARPSHVVAAIALIASLIAAVGTTLAWWTNGAVTLSAFEMPASPPGEEIVVAAAVGATAWLLVLSLPGPAPGGVAAASLVSAAAAVMVLVDARRALEAIDRANPAVVLFDVSPRPGAGLWLTVGAAATLLACSVVGMALALGEHRASSRSRRKPSSSPPTLASTSTSTLIHASSGGTV